MISRIAALSLTLALAGCGAIIETRYNFNAPRDSRGQGCVYQCEHIRTQCERIEDLEESRCERNSRYDQAECEREIRQEYGRSPEWYECTGDLCAADYSGCESEYKRCFVGCGGTITESKFCSLNCDQLTPEQIRELEEANAERPHRKQSSSAKSKSKR